MPRSSSSAPSQRQLRVGEQARHALAEVLQRGDVHDEQVEGKVVSVSEVRMSPDLKIATAYIAPIGVEDGEPVVTALNRNAKFIRGRVSRSLRHLRYMPEFRFRLDTGFDNFERIDRLLKSPEVVRDLGHDDPDHDGPDHGGGEEA